MHIPSPSTYAAVTRLHELLLGMLPRGWRSVELTFERNDWVLRVVNLQVQALAPGNQPPFLGLDQNASIAAINEAFALMAKELGGAWTGTRARFSRESESPELQLLDANGGVQSRLALDASAVASLIVTDALFDEIDRAHRAFDARQQAFDGVIRGFRQWGFDQDTGRLSFTLADGRPLEGVGWIVGSWAKGDASWLWGWANDSIDARSRAVTAAIRDAAQNAPGLAALRTRSFGCEMAFASLLALVAAERIGATGVFGGTHGGGAVFIAAMP